MPGGIGPVDPKCAKALCQAHREIKLPPTADERRIFYNLSMDRVHYVPDRDALYFVDSRHSGVQNILDAELRSMGVTAQITQLHIDNLGIFNGGKRIILPPDQARSVLVALRLQGIRISVSC